MSGKLPHIQLYPGDWLRDNVAGCSLAAQGLWFRMLLLAHEAKQYGYLAMNGSPIPSDFIARKCGCDSLAQYETLLDELDRAGVPSRTPEGIIYSRRMVRDAKARAAVKERVRKHRSNGASNAPCNATGNAHVTANDNASGIGNGMGRVQGRAGPQDGGGVALSTAEAYPPALAASAEWVACWEGEWLPHLAAKHGDRIPPLGTVAAQLAWCAEVGPARAIAACRHAIFVGLKAPAEPRPAGGADKTKTKRGFEHAKTSYAQFG